MSFLVLCMSKKTDFHLKCHSKKGLLTFVTLREDSNLMWKCSYQRAAIYFGFVFSFHEESQQLPFPFDKYWSPSNEAKAVLFQDVVAVLHHLWAVIVRGRGK